VVLVVDEWLPFAVVLVVDEDEQVFSIEDVDDVDDDESDDIIIVSRGVLCSVDVDDVSFRDACDEISLDVVVVWMEDWGGDDGGDGGVSIMEEVVVVDDDDDVINLLLLFWIWVCSCEQSTQHSFSVVLWTFRLRLDKFFLNHAWFRASSTVRRCLKKLFLKNKKGIFHHSLKLSFFAISPYRWMGTPK